MKLFDFFKKKNKIFSDEDIEKEYEKVQRRIQSQRMPSFENAVERLAKKTCRPQKGDDILFLKADFIRCCSYTSRMNRCYYSTKYKKGQFRSVPLWCQKWQNHEQAARVLAQKKWREFVIQQKGR